jgi:glucoamylase
VASLSSPWGECKTDDNPNDRGYRYVWPRDLYHVAQAFIALGDLDSARTTLAYLDDTLQRPDGSFPQNADVNGVANWLGLQMDEVADPILLAHALEARERYESLVRPAADFIAGAGPRTGQERWEENGGYSPHSIAAQIAALIAAADMAEHAGDSASAAKWRTFADEWERQLETWTFTTSGTLGDGRYFLRVTEGEPNDAQERIVIANGGGGQAMLAVVDVSALELVRLGVRAPGAPSILDTLPEIDATIREQTPNGPGWHRYAFDAYGEPGPGQCPTGQGQLWPLFNGERGLYALAAGQPDDARAMLDGMERFANEGLMLPEQVFAETGEGTGSATPLAWAHAEYILLALSLQEGRVLDLPAVVAEHYGNQP